MGNELGLPLGETVWYGNYRLLQRHTEKYVDVSAQTHTESQLEEPVREVVGMGVRRLIGAAVESAIREP